MMELAVLFIVIVVAFWLTGKFVSLNATMNEEEVARLLAREAEKVYRDDPRRARRLMEAADALVERSKRCP